MSVENLAVLRRIPVIVAIRVVDEVGPRKPHHGAISGRTQRAV